MSSPMIHLTRDQYRAEMEFRLGRFLRPEGVQAVLATQYPRDTALAACEMLFRGVDPPRLPEREDWTAPQIDAMCVALEACGRLSADGFEAQRAGLTMEAFRLAERPEKDPAGGTVVYDASWGVTLPPIPLNGDQVDVAEVPADA